MTDEKLKEIDMFFSRYRDVVSIQSVRVSEFQRQFSRLKQDFARIQQDAWKQARLNAPDFNVFNILRLSRMETRTHSAMLSHLLNPRGSHGQGLLFLQTFMTKCANRGNNFPNLSSMMEIGDWDVSTELSTSEGRLDIVVRNPDISYLCIIENKIDAPEQLKQLARYQKWMRTQENIYQIQTLIFLTPSGYAPITADGENYLCLSYREDIYSWLNGALENIEAKKVKETVRQYAELIYNL